MYRARGWLIGLPVLAIFFLLGTHQTWASDARQVFTFEKEKLSIRNVSQHDVIRYEGLELSREVSSPQLPVRRVLLALPPGKNIAKIQVNILESELLEGQHNVFHVQAPQILSIPDVAVTKRDEGVYSSSQPYPKEAARIGPGGFFSGYSIGTLFISPVRYVPAQKKLIFCSRIEVLITYGDSGRQPIPCRTTQYSDALHRGTLTKLVENPRALERPQLMRVEGSSALTGEDHVYVIITADSLVSTFNPLASWKNKKGLSATTVTTSWIYSNYSGVDEAEKIREFIKDAYQTWGTLWVLLGGDTDVVPVRLAYAMDCELGLPYLNDIPCDLYYSDLDGDWNADADSLYGEVTDDVDMFPDLYVGRAPVENAAEAAVFVGKVLVYEMNAPNGHELDMLFLSEILWDDPYTDSGLSKNHIDSLYVPGRFDPITKLYESLGNETYPAVMDAFNTGQNIINHTGHAWYTVLGIGDGYMQISDVDALTNSPKLSILFSIGCWPAAIDYDCIAEHFLTNPDGGGVAFLGNSRYGWGSPGNPLYGYSDRFDQTFFKLLFEDGIYNIGGTLAATKAAYVTFAGQENVYRWCEYELNLLGDPEMPIWTDTPRLLTVTGPVELPLGVSLCPITVTDTGNPVAGALVCVMQDTHVYETGFTDYNGQVQLEISAGSVLPVDVTVTAQNYVPYEGTLPVVTGEPLVLIRSYATNGSAEGYVTPGGLVSVDACFKNYGGDTAVGVSAVLKSENALITVIDSTESLGDIPPGDSIIVAGAFSLQAGTGLANGDVVYLGVDLSETSGTPREETIALTGAAPVLTYGGHGVTDYFSGDRDGFAEPGETVSVGITVYNSGLAAAQNVTATVECGNPGVTVIGSELQFGNVPASGSKQAFSSIAVDPSCPAPSFPEIDIAFEAQGGFHFDRNFLLSVGEIGFEDNLESGDGYWTHSGTLDLWHLTSNRVHSGTTSWYCGVGGGIYTYVHNMDTSLELVPVETGQDAALSFWCWHKFTTYGSDGFYVEVNDGSGWSTLDYIGSGGALGTLPTGNDWMKYSYDLSRYPAGTALTLRFRFVSDGEDTAEGAYIDDVTIVGSEWPDGPPPPIPLLTGPGMIVVVLLIVGGGAIVIRRRSRA